MWKLPRVEDYDPSFDFLPLVNVSLEEVPLSIHEIVGEDRDCCCKRIAVVRMALERWARERGPKIVPMEPYIALFAERRLLKEMKRCR